MSETIQNQPFSKGPSKIDRRKLLKLGALVLTGLVGTPFDSFASTGDEHVTGNRSNQKIIIAGAGVAGLSAAFELKRMGYQV